MRAATWKDVPVPPIMAHLPRDKRGYPIPYNVYRDAAGQPHFTINDQPKALRCLKHDLCPISGTPLNRFRWFVGGPLSAFHDDGAYVDLPMHQACMEYALQVCPYLAAPRYLKRIDTATLDNSQPGASTMIAVDPTVLDERPLVFVAVMTTGHQRYADGLGGYRLRPKRPYRDVAYWRHGVRLSEDEGRQIAEEVLQRPVPPLKARKIKIIAA